MPIFVEIGPPVLKKKIFLRVFTIHGHGGHLGHVTWISYIYVRRKVGIGSIPELHLRKVGIPTLSADSRIVSDNSRIV